MENKLDIIVEVITKSQAQLDELRKKISSLENDLGRANSRAGSTGMSFSSMAAAMGIGTTAALAFRDGLNKAVQVARDSIEAFNTYESAMIGLSSVSAAFGENQTEARNAAKSLASDGLMSVSQSAEGLKNLLASGFSMDEAINLMNAFRDAAAFNRQGTLSFGQAIVGATQGIKNQNSIMVDNVGITKNLSMIMKEAGLSVDDLASVTSDASVRQKLYNGLLQEASAFSGDAERAAGTLQGQMQTLDTSMFNLQKTIGEALAPAWESFVGGAVVNADLLAGSVGDAMLAIQVRLLNAQGIVMKVGSVIGNTFMSMIEVVGAASQAFMKFMTLDFSGAADAAQQAFQSAGKRVQAIRSDFAAIEDFIGAKVEKAGTKFYGFENNVNKAMTGAGNAVSKNSDKIAKALDKISDELKRFEKDSAKAASAFQERLGDAIRRHIEAIKDLRNEISELNRDFAEASAERLETHQDRLEDIKGNYDEEVEGLRANLRRQLSERHRSDEDLQRILEARIAEVLAKRDEEIRKEEEKFQKQEEKERISHERRLASVQAKLNEELEIQKRHQGDFDALRDKAVEDDITRLKNAFAAEMDERRREHEERMAELKKQYDEIAKVKSSGDAKIASRAPTNTNKPASSVNKGEPMPNFSPISGVGTKSPGGGWRFTTAGWVRALKGNIIPGRGPVPMVAHGGETFLTQRQTRGLLKILEDMADGTQSPQSKQININMNNQIHTDIDREQLLRDLKFRLATA